MRDKPSMLPSAIVAAAVLSSAALSAAALAQTDVADRALADLHDFMEFMNDFTRGVELDETAIQSVLEHWADFEALDSATQDDDLSQVQQEVEEALANPTYRSWAAARGLELDSWLRSSMRLQSLFMAKQWRDNEALIARQRSELEAMIEGQCGEAEVDRCPEMREALAQLRAVSDQMDSAIESVRTPSANEATLLERYEQDLWLLFDMNDEEDEWDDD